MIHILWPTIRPTTFLETYTHWLQTAAWPGDISTTVAVNTEEQKSMLGDHNVIVIGDAKRGVARASYELSSRLEGNDEDIVILASDDFYSPRAWDIWLRKEFAEYDGGILVNDGYQYGGCVTIPILKYSCLVKMNKIIYHPYYQHLYSDAELYDVLEQMGLLKNLREASPLFEHRHWANNKRKWDGVDQTNNQCSGIDEKLYFERKTMGLRYKILV